MARKRATDLSKTDMTMLVLIVLLVIFGLAVLFSSSEYNGRVRFGDSACYFKKQLFATALGMGVMYMVSSIDYHFFLRLGPVAYLISMFLSGAVLFVGQEINGSKRWLNLGPLSFQPSEFAKVAVILFLAWQIERTKKATMGFGFMCRTILTLLPIIGLVGSNNLSTAIIILGIGGILIFVSNPGYLEFIGLGSAGAGFIAVFLAAESYRLERLAIWRNPEKYEKGFDEKKFIEDFMTSKKIKTKKDAMKDLRKQIKKESYYQDKIKRGLQKKYPEAFIRKVPQGAYCQAGIPDILMIYKGHYFGFEVKRPVVGIRSKLQEQTVLKIREAGGTAEFVTWPEEAIAEVEKYEQK